MMKEDGNLVLSYINQTRVLWESKTSGRGGDRLSIESNGNLVIYDENNQVVWQADTVGVGDYLRLENDANLVLYDRNGFEIWTSRTALSNKSYFKINLYYKMKILINLKYHFKAKINCKYS